MKRCAILFCFLLLNLCATSQWYKPEAIPKRIAAKYSTALNEMVQQRNHIAAISLLQECIEAQPSFVDAWLSLAGMFAEKKDYVQSVTHYQKAFALDSMYCQPFLLPYSISLAGTGNFSEALSTTEKILSLTNSSERVKKAATYRNACFRFALDWEVKNKGEKTVYKPINMGNRVNSKWSEYFPSLTVDGSTLVFTRLTEKGNEDFYFSRHDTKTWSDVNPLPGNLNTNENEGAQHIAQDGSMLVFAGCNMQDGEGSCDIYFSFLNADSTWGPRINAGQNINTSFWESQPCLSPDKKAIYFAARDPSGFGGSDLYVSYLQPNGRWSKSFNLGPEINTKGDESSPFLHADHQTLYFTSNGHMGYGGTDLYVSRRIAHGTWGKPENLGYPINTIDDESSLIVASNGVTAYFAAERTEGYGGMDLYYFELPQPVRPFTTGWVQGKVYDAITGKGLPASIMLTAVDSKMQLNEVQANEDGQYLITLPLSKEYILNVKQRGYLFSSSVFKLNERNADSAYVLNIPLTPIVANARMVLNNILFETGSYTLQSVSSIELDKLADLLKEHPCMRIEIGGHTDGIGKAQDNQLLSENRARTVMNYLLHKGIPAIQMQMKGYGATAPIADNNTEEGRAQNRRTEIKVLSATL
ncbi:MAG: OmpA family protein [Chitinophagaceae bacterium]